LGGKEVYIVYITGPSFGETSRMKRLRHYIETVGKPLEDIGEPEHGARNYEVDGLQVSIPFSRGSGEFQVGVVVDSDEDLGRAKQLAWKLRRLFGLKGSIRVEHYGEDLPTLIIGPDRYVSPDYPIYYKEDDSVDVSRTLKGMPSLEEEKKLEEELRKTQEVVNNFYRETKEREKYGPLVDLLNEDLEGKLGDFGEEK
jgi:hypothetical protein